MGKALEFNRKDYICKSKADKKDLNRFLFSLSKRSKTKKSKSTKFKPIKSRIVGYNKRYNSSGELAISEFLNEISIKFIREKRFNSLKNPNTGAHLFMDFFLPEHNICIEFDGIQHFKYVKDFHKFTEDFTAQQSRDRVKDTWCEDNGFRMIRIKYNQKKLIPEILSFLKNDNCL